MQRRRSRAEYAYFLLIIFCALFAGCVNDKPITTGVGQPVGDAVSAVIGPKGGELASADGRLSMSVPPGTVAEDTTFSIELITSLVPSAIGAGYRLEPGEQPLRSRSALPSAFQRQALNAPASEGSALLFRKITATGAG